MKKKLLTKVIALTLTAVLILQTNILDVFAVGFDRDQSYNLSWRELQEIGTEVIKPGEELDNSSVSMYEETDVVRVMIVMEKEPALELSQGEDFTLTDEMIEYRQELKDEQLALIEKISSDILGGEELSVIWNLTLAANVISANIQYGYIDDIEAMDGVSNVIIEPQHQPMDDVEADTRNIISQDMTGALGVKNESGYTGAGRRVAIVDTGTDTDHWSFNAESYEFALSVLAEEKGMTKEAYMESLDLLTVEGIDSVLSQLNCYARMDGDLTAEDLYISSKLPFNFNYIDINLDVTHTAEGDENGSHGSHVAGITTANTYINVKDIYDFNGDRSFDVKDALTLMEFAICDKPMNNSAMYSDINEDGRFTAYDVFKLLKYYEGEGGFFKADETVAVTGVAPEAQLITMKVFGVAGGAYATDYMAAAEDAIILGCDVANLSLGAPYAGFSTPVEDTVEANAFVSSVLETIGESDMVFATAAGNQGNWADYSDMFFWQMDGYMYTDEAGTSTLGTPASFKQSFSVASVDNRNTVTIMHTWFSSMGGNEKFDAFLQPSPSEGVEPWKSLDPIGKGASYDVVFLGDPTNLFAGDEQTDMTIYAGNESDFANADLEGKIVMVARGNNVNFTDKHYYAALADAAAVIVYNNVPDGGIINMSLDGSGATIPASFVTYEDALQIFEMAKLHNGQYTVNAFIREQIALEIGEGTNYTMSSFSSWGATGKLEIKPEIAAPGGSIYSINGMDETRGGYEVMSGTSMATPHISGLVALADQYFEAEEILELARELTGNNDLTLRELAQSMLMSTAMPIIEYVDEEGYPIEYSVRNQGAGLAQIQNLVNAESFIMVDGQEGGKVKAELGDGTDAWEFTFTIHNITDESMTYALDASVLTSSLTYLPSDQYAQMFGIQYNDEVFYYTLDQMMQLAANVEFAGENVNGQTVVVDGYDTATVTVTIDVDEEFANLLAEYYGFENGFYVEGYVYVTPEDGVEHSIPMLGWYGNWSDPSMYDSGNIFDYIYGDIDRPSHMYNFQKNLLTWAPNGAPDEYIYTGNIYGGLVQQGDQIGVIGDSRYLEERNAINSDGNGIWGLSSIYPTLIRNAGDCQIEVTDADTGELYFLDDFGDWDTRLVGSFFYLAQGMWYDTTVDNQIQLNWDYTDLDGNPLENGTRVKIALRCAPEYYIDEDGNTDWDAVGKGGELAFAFTIDNEAPQLSGENAFVLEEENNGETSTLSVRVQDNEYIAAVILLTGAADTAIEYNYPDMDADKRGQAVTVEFDVTEYRELYGNKATVVVCDYAGNESYYSLNLNGEGEAYGDFVGFKYDAEGYANTWVSFDADVNRNETTMFSSFDEIVAAEYVNGYVFMQNNKGELYAVPYEDMLADTVEFEETYVGTLENVYQDFAYNYAEGCLMGLSNYESNWGPQADIFKIYLEDLYEEPHATQSDAYGYTVACETDGTVHLLAVEYDYETKVTGDIVCLYTLESGGWIFEKVGSTDLVADYAQSMTYNHNDGKLYWSRFAVNGLDGLISQLVVVDTEDASCEVVGTLSGETAALMAPLTPETAAKTEYQNVPEFDVNIIGEPKLNATDVTVSLGKTVTLKCSFEPWYTERKAVTWESDNPTVATVEDGVVKGVSAGTANITVTSVEDPSLYATCKVVVSALSVEIEGFVSYTPGGINAIGESRFYSYTMDEGQAEMVLGESFITGDEFAGFGKKIGASIEAKGYIWACEWGNTGLIYKIDKTTGKVVDMLSPIDGDMMFGMAYSETTDMFTGIMNFYLYVDQPFTHEAEEDMLASRDEATNQFTWHKVDMSQYLNASQGSYVTKEDGLITDVVFCGITNIDYAEGEAPTMQPYKDFLGDYIMGMSPMYTPDTTLALLDNIGRIWYIDEMTGWYKYEEEGMTMYINAEDPMEATEMIDPTTNGVFAVEYPAEDGGKSTYSVFMIRSIQDTPFVNKFMEDDLGITYHFSSIHFVGWNESTDIDPMTGASYVKDPMFVVSTYDYWNEDATNELYLMYPGHWGIDSMSGMDVETSGALYELGDTGFGYLVATITKARYIGGLGEN